MFGELMAIAKALFAFVKFLFTAPMLHFTILGIAGAVSRAKISRR